MTIGADGDGPRGHRLLSVGLPVFNGEAYVADAIASVLGQQDVDLELVIADNGSTDQTEEVCREAIRGDDRARYVRSEVNRGAAWNFNRVVELATGFYFKWAAHDDLCSPGLAARCIDVLAEHPVVSLAFARVVDIGTQGDELRSRPSYDLVHGVSPARRARTVLSTPTPCFEVFGVARRHQLLETDLIGSYTSSDRTLIFEMALRGRFVEVQDELLYHREHSSRSTYRYPQAHDRTAWFDTTAGTTWSMPRWRLLGEHLRAVRRARLDAGDEALCHAAVLRWGAGRADGLARDVVGVTRRALASR